MSSKKSTKSQSEIDNKQLHTDLVQVFTDSGFTHLPSEGKEINISGRTGEFDAIFIHKNLIVFSEETTLKEPEAHLTKKVDFYKHCKKFKNELIDFLAQNFLQFKNVSMSEYEIDDFELVFTYSSAQGLKENYATRHPDTVCVIDKNSLSYFVVISKTIKKSARFELFKFLNVDPNNIGTANSSTPSNTYNALILPHSPSGLPEGHVIISFLADPNILLEQSYVLRKDGWRDRDGVYQRMLIKSKIRGMREYLFQEGRVFINNIIVTLPEDTQFFDQYGSALMPPHSSSLVRESVKFTIPKRPSTIGIIDGQHRVFSYHEGDDAHEKHISKMRNKQHILVTGIVYPASLSKEERIKFEAKLFLEINDKQTKTKSALRQAIAAIAEPFANASIAKSVVNKLAMEKPMEDIFEQHFSDKGRLKTASIVSYGVSKIVNPDSRDSLFQVWDSTNKQKLLAKEDYALLDEYIQFCSSEIRTFISAFRNNIPHDMWTLDQRQSRILTTTTIIGLIVCLRKIIETGKTRSFEHYNKGFSKISLEKFNPKSKYKSSHWKELGDDIYEECFTSLP